jgi:hypothetical protein
MRSQPLTPDQRAARLASRQYGLITIASHLTAAALFGAWRPPVLPHVLGPRGRSGRAGLELVHTGTVGAADRCFVDRIPCTTPARTLLDNAAKVDRLSLECLTQHEIREDDGTFVARVDVASPSRMLAFEYDSDRWHNPR